MAVNKTNSIGSVFLGDIQRQRILSTSTPPSSPPPHLASQSIDDLIDDAELRQAQAQAHARSFSRSSSQSPNHPLFPRNMFSPPPISASASASSPPPFANLNIQPTIAPEVSLDLRLRWLETLVFGTKGDVKEKVLASMKLSGGDDEKFVGVYGVKEVKTLVRSVEDIQRRLDGIVQGNEGMKRFLEQYEQHAHILTPAFALSSNIPPLSSPPYDNLSPSELDSLLQEMESDIRSADRDLREIELLERRNVTSAGKLGNYEALEGRLDNLLGEHRKDVKLAKELEERVGRLMDRYATNVDTLSELFVAWDDTLQEAEEQVVKLGKERKERERLGYEP